MDISVRSPKGIMYDVGVPDQDVQRGIRPEVSITPPRELPVGDGYPDPELYIFLAAVVMPWFAKQKGNFQRPLPALR